MKQIILYCLFSLALTVPAYASLDSLEVVAVVGETPISNLDLADRTQLIMRSSGLSEAPEIRQKVMAQALKQLVDEQLQADEAVKRGIIVSNAEIAASISDLEVQNRQPPGSLRTFMETKGVSWDAFLKQLRGQLLWNKLLTQAVSPKVRISEAQYQAAAKNQRLVESGQEYNVTPLVLPIESPEKEDELMKLAQKIVQDVKAGAPLENIMQQLMGMPPGQEPRFWVTASQMEPALAQGLQNASKGDLIGPIRSTRGIHIMRINDKRAKTNVKVVDPSQVILKEVLLGLAPDATKREVDLTMNIAQAIAQNPGTCLQHSVAGVERFDGTDIKVSFLQSLMSELPPYARQQAEKLTVGEVGEPFATREGIRFYILCEKVEKPVEVTADDALRERLFREKVELEASKFMRKLRRESFIEVRI